MGGMQPLFMPDMLMLGVLLMPWDVILLLFMPTLLLITYRLPPEDP